MHLAEKNMLTLDDDISIFFNKAIRNPFYQDIPITIKMLLSHTSSLRDHDCYNYPVGVNILDVLEIKEHWADESKTEIIVDDKVIKQTSTASMEPGKFFSYCNLNYGLIATIIEKITNQRFDLYMNETIFKLFDEPMTFNLQVFSENQRKHLTKLGTFDENLNWTTNLDLDEVLSRDYTNYVIGSNGTVFGPHGSLYTTLGGLVSLTKYLFDTEDNPINQNTRKEFFNTVWDYDEVIDNGHCYFGLMKRYASGIHKLTNSNTDRLLEDINLEFLGHSADAYGLLGGYYIHPKEGNGIIYLITGTSENIEKYPGKYSAFHLYEETIINAVKDYI